MKCSASNATMKIPTFSFWSAAVAVATASSSTRRPGAGAGLVSWLVLRILALPSKPSDYSPSAARR